MMDHEVPNEGTDSGAAASGKNWYPIKGDKEADQQHRGMANQQKEIPVRFPPDNEEQQGPCTRRVCPDCVLKDRIKQWAQRPDYLRQENPDWATPQGVKRDMRMQNKGRLWNQAGKHIQAAKTELKSGNNLEGNLNRNKRKQEIIKRSHLLAQALLDSLNSGNLLEAFRIAGARMVEDSEVGQTYVEAYNRAMLDESDEEAQNCLDNAETEMAMTTNYQACIEYGAQQTKMLKALDFIDAYGEGLRLYNVCRAKTKYDLKKDKMCSCGLAFPAKLWTKKFPERPWSWKFVCKVDWQQLIKAQLELPDDEQLRSWVEDMHKEYGEEENWPKIGCGSNFVPYAKGFSMVTEIKCPDGQWTAFSSDRLPPQLDDEIKKVQAAFYLAGRKLNAEELKDIIPVSFPMTNKLKGFPFIAYYPIEEWDEAQLPCFSATSWCKLAMMTAEKDMTNLHQCFEVARKLKDTLSCL